MKNTEKDKKENKTCLVVVWSLSRVQLFATPWTVARQASLPSPSPRACSNSSPLSQWCHPTISSSVVPFSSCLQSFPASGSFLISRLSESGGQSIGASASVLPVNIQDWFPLGLTCLISLFDQQGVIMLFSLNIYQLCIFSFKIILIIFYIKSKISFLF